jgi:tellurite resistance protein
MIATKLSPPTPAKTAKTRQTVVDSGTDTGTERLNMNIKTSNTKSANPSVPTALDKKELKKEKRKARRAAEAAAAVAAAGGPPVSGSQSGTEQKVIIPADEKALRFLNPRPCHK